MRGDAKLQNSEAVCGKNKLMTTSAKVLETGNSVKEHSGEEIQEKKRKTAIAVTNLLASVPVNHKVKPPLKQYNGRCGFRTENIQQSVNSYQQKWSCSKSYFMCQRLIGNS